MPSWYRSGRFILDTNTDLRVPLCVSQNLEESDDRDSGGSYYECSDSECNPDDRYVGWEEDEDEADDEDDTPDDPDPPVSYDPTEQPPEGRHWLRAGIELEGAWNISRAALRDCCSTRGTVKGDGSVRANPTTSNGHIGEIATRPYKTVEGIVKCVTLLYPDVVDDSCGMHVHTSWTLGDYVRLADDAFPPYFRTRMAEYAKTLPFGRGRYALVHRLAGRNDYCRINADTDGDRALSGGGVDRYRQINYSWTAHKTIECRLLPMFDTKEEAIHAIMTLLGIYEEYLSNVAVPLDDELVDCSEEFSDEPVIALNYDSEPIETEEIFDFQVCDDVAVADLPAGSIVMLRGWTRDQQTYVLRTATAARINELVDQGIS